MQKIDKTLNTLEDEIRFFVLNGNRLFFVRLFLSAAICLNILFLSLPDTKIIQHHYSLFSIMNKDAASYMSVLIILVFLFELTPLLSYVLFFWLCYSVRCFEDAANGGNILSCILSFLLIPFGLLKLFGSSSDIKKYTVNLLCCLSLFLIRLQLAVVYFFSAYLKIKFVTWRNGDAIIYWMNDSFYGLPQRLEWLRLILTKPAIAGFVSWCVLLFEFVLGFAFATSKKFRRKLLPAAVIFHILIAVCHGIVDFSIVMFAALILYLLPINTNKNARYFL